MKTLKHAAAALLLSFLALCLGCTHPAVIPARSVARVDTAGLQEAIALATSALQGQSHYTTENWTLISTRQILINNRYVWRITFKPTRLIPKDPSTKPIGAGGELFVNVDPVTQGTEIRFGE